MEQKVKPEELSPEPPKPERFRKKPIEVEAIQYTPENKTAIQQFLNDVEHGFTDEGLLIRTLEGVMKADKNDWVIKGVEGEFYPCKPSVFEATYEPLVS